MTKPMHIWLKAGERIYINGAVVRADRKVAIELLNDVVFLREAHVLQADETKTPLRQLYFVLQTILMNPGEAEVARRIFHDIYRSTEASFTTHSVLSGLRDVERLVEQGYVYEALKAIRGLYSAEAAILGGEASRQPSRAA